MGAAPWDLKAADYPCWMCAAPCKAKIAWHFSPKIINPHQNNRKALHSATGLMP